MKNKIRNCKFTRDRDRLIRRYNSYKDWKYSDWDLFEEPTIWQRIHWRDRSYYNLYIKDRVFDWNMVEGLCYDNYRNAVSRIKYKRMYK